MTSRLRPWWIAVRPFAFPAAILPVVFGTVTALAAAGANFNTVRFFLALIAMIALQSSANLINDAHDFERGLDDKVLPASGAVVRGLISPQEARNGAVLTLLLGIIIGIFLAWQAGLAILFCGIIGVTSCLLYSLNKFGLKENGLGDIAVLINFGVLANVGSWVLQTEQFSWYSVFWSLPIGLLIVAILHANNWRDIVGDKHQNVRTVAGYLGNNVSLHYYAFLILTPFALVILFVLAPLIFADIKGLPGGTLFCLIALPKAIKLITSLVSEYRRHDSRAIMTRLDAETAQLTVLFGILIVAGALVSLLIDTIIIN